MAVWQRVKLSIGFAKDTFKKKREREKTKKGSLNMFVKQIYFVQQKMNRALSCN